jgi:hypothetical protein
VALLLLNPSAAHAHHGGIWNSFKVAHRIKDYRELRPLFTDAAWEGKDGVAGKKLNEMTRAAEAVEYNPGNQQVSKERHIMGLRFVDRSQKSYWVYLLLEPLEKPINVDIAMHGFGSKWRVIRLTKSYEEAEKYLEPALKMFRPGRKQTGGSIVRSDES